MASGEKSKSASKKLELHVRVLEGRNDHHRVESAFKALAVSLRAAVRSSDASISTKGTLQ